jgi:hypothetical protein
MKQSLTAALIFRTHELEERLAHYEAQDKHLPQPLNLPLEIPSNVDIAPWQNTGSPAVDDAPSMCDQVRELLCLTVCDAGSISSLSTSGAPNPVMSQSSDQYGPLHSFARSLFADFTLHSSPETGFLCPSSYNV